MFSRAYSYLSLRQSVGMCLTRCACQCDVQQCTRGAFLCESVCSVSESSELKVKRKVDGGESGRRGCRSHLMLYNVDFAVSLEQQSSSGAAQSTDGLMIKRRMAQALI